MIQASIAGNEKSDPSMMSRLLNEISDPARVRALKKAIEGLEKHGWRVFRRFRFRVASPPIFPYRKPVLIPSNW
jgi:hypothetical protein